MPKVPTFLNAFKCCRLYCITIVLRCHTAFSAMEMESENQVKILAESVSFDANTLEKGINQCFPCLREDKII